MSDGRPTWRIISSDYIVNDKWLKLRADSCKTPSGALIEPYYVFEYPEWANCLVVDAEMNAILVRQYRHAAGAYVLEPVAGWLDPEDPSPEVAIARELQEEIGYVGGTIFRTGITYTNPATMTNKNYSFLAVGGACTESTNHGIGEQHTLSIERIPLKRLWSIAGDSGNPGASETMQSYHLANFYLAQQFIRTSDDPRIKSLRVTLP